MTSIAHATLENDLTRQNDQLFTECDEPGQPGGAVMVIHKGKVIHATGYGLADVDAGTPADASALTAGCHTITD